MHAHAAEAGEVVDRASWTGVIGTRTDDVAALSVRACLAQAKETASSPFLALGNDGQQWWVKPPQAALDKALVTELVVGRVGALIGAPVCHVEAIQIPDALLPWELRPGTPLPTGIGSATANLPGAIEEIRPNLTRRYDDDNRRRHAGVYALVDWCFGSDLQWLLRADAEWQLFSHDHGWYLPPSGQAWDEQSLECNVDTPCLVPDDPAGLDPIELERLASSLDGITQADLLHVLKSVPTSWPVIDRELEALGWFLQTRAPEVAERLRGLGGSS